MAETPTWIRALQVFVLSTSGVLSGLTFGYSWAAIPSILLAPSPLGVRQWKTAYNRGKATAIPMAALSSLSFAVLAYSSHVLPTRSSYPIRGLYTSAALSTLSMVPFTLSMMRSVNDKLMAKAADAEKGSEDIFAEGESSKELIDWWATLNFMRGLFPLTGTVLGIWATLN